MSTLPIASVSEAVSDTVWPAMIPGAAGATLIAATGASATVTVLVPVALPLVAVIVVLPGVTPVTTPLDDTVAAAPLLELHVTARPTSTFPFASRTPAASVVVCATNTVVVEGVTVTLAAGTALTDTAAVALFPSLVAVIVALPGEMPVTRPLDDTVAMPEADVVQVTVRPVSVAPRTSCSVGTSVAVCPTKRLGAVGASVIVATGASVTVTVVLADLPSLVAVTIDVPGPAAATRPIADTVATEALLVVHVTVRSIAIVPSVSVMNGVNVPVSPTVSASADGSWTNPTGTRDTVTATVAVCPSDVTVIVAVPAATPVTTPLLDAVATPLLLELKVTTRPVSGVPFTSFTVTVSVAE